MDTNFEQIIPWNGENDTGKDVRLKWQRNFDRIKANFEELSDLFEKVNLGTDEAPAWAIRAKYGLYTDDWISAKGLNPDSPAEVSGATELSKLTDVLITDLKDGQILAYDKPTDKWVNRDAVAGGLDETKLAEYLTTHQYTTQEWITQQGYATQSWANGQFAKATVAINAGTGLTGGGTLTASRTLSLAQVGTAGTYTKVTVDAYGRVTKGTTLAAADIPTLSISKVSGLQSALDAKLDASAFSDLFEKVALSGGGYAIRAKYGLYSDDWLSVKGANPSAGGAVAGVTELAKLTDVTISSPQNGQALVYRDGKWRNESIDTGASSWDEIEGKPEWMSQTVGSNYEPIFWKDGVPVKCLTTFLTDRKAMKDTSTGTDWNKLLTPGMYFTSTEGNLSGETGSPGGYYGYGTLAILGAGDSSSGGARTQMYFTHGTDAFYRTTYGESDTRWSAWSRFVTNNNVSSYVGLYNAASATKLQTSRTLWGQSFNGTADVSGTLSGVSGITFSEAQGATMDANGNIYLERLTSSSAFWFVGIPTSTKRFVVKPNGYVGISTTTPAYNLHVEGDIYASNSIRIGNGTITWDASTGAFHFSHGVYSDSFMSAKGKNADAGGTVAGGGGEVHLRDIVDMADEWKLITSVSTIPDTMSRWPTWAEVTGKPSWRGSTKPSYTWSEISGKPSTFTPSSHTHTLSQISDLHSSWDSYLKSAPSFATTSSNVYSATRLQTTRTLWGQSFNGTANVSGTLSGVSGITFSDAQGATMDANGNIYLERLTSSSAFWFVGIPASTKRFVVKPNGYVGISTTTPAYNLHIVGTAYATGGFQNGSDIRYKHILQDLPLTADQVAAAPSFLFRWTDGTDRAIHAGTSAQYWQTVLPQVVRTGGDGRLSMQYGVAALLSAITLAKTAVDHEARLRKLEERMIA